MLEELKSRLRITWEDEDTELEKIIKKSKAYLEVLSGAPFNYEENSEAAELVLERSRYVYNNAADEFSKNFADDLMRLRLAAAIKVRSEANASTT
jgi:Phage gp6-like head-tail connector protein